MLRRLSFLVALLIFVSCTNRSTTHSGNVVEEFHSRHKAISEAMTEGDVERAKQLSRDTNTWLESLSAEEQTLISRTLTHTEH